MIAWLKAEGLAAVIITVVLYACVVPALTELDRAADANMVASIEYSLPGGEQ